MPNTFADLDQLPVTDIITVDGMQVQLSSLTISYLR
jgi:hypothetical protein